MKKIIALFGGSFNPPTRRHREIGLLLLEQLPVEQVWYLVAPQNPFKSTQGMARFEDRVAMMRLNLAGDDGLVVQDIEARYAKEFGVAAINSAVSLRCLTRDFPQHRFLWVVGADNFTSMHLWSGYQQIISNHPVVVVPRAGFKASIATCPAAKALTRLRNADDARTRVGWFMLRVSLNDINATACREALCARRWPMAMKPTVARYALSGNLYGGAPSAA